MSTVQLSNVDLNLLVVMRVLLTTHSVKLAAAKLRVTPSAVSHSLGRLRDLFGDPLFVREGQRVTPTALATELAEPIDRVLVEIESVLARKRRFDPKKLRRVFRLGTPDYAQLVVVPELLAILRDRAPSTEMECQSPGLEIDALVRDRTLDAAIGSAFQPLPGLVIHKLYDEHLVLVARKGGAPKGLEGYLAREHVVVSPRGQPGSIVDRALAAQHRSRKVVFRTPQFLAALHLCATSDLVTAVPSRLVALHSEVDGLRVSRRSSGKARRPTAYSASGKARRPTAYSASVEAAQRSQARWIGGLNPSTSLCRATSRDRRAHAAARGEGAAAGDRALHRRHPLLRDLPLRSGAAVVPAAIAETIR